MSLVLSPVQLVGDLQDDASAVLAVRKLSFAYGERPILREVSFAAHPGDLIALLGPNGVGKSTLFRCVLGFLKGYEGSILVGGHDANSLSAREMARLVAYIPQSSAQIFDYTVMELVLMGVASQLKLFATPSKAQEEEALTVLRSLNIDHLAYRGCGQISGGEYQLALLARALMQKAKILIMDEPTANLDYGNQYRVMERIAGLAHRDFIVLLSAHDPNQVLQHANRVLIIKEGRLCADGSPQAVMTEQMLSSIYNIQVHRHNLQDNGHEYHICLPVGSKVE
jgi:iron complex transport system ATP-binding protein